MKSILVLFSILFYCVNGHDFKNAIAKSVKDIEKFRNDQLIPGLSVGVSHNASHVWLKSFGFADIENEVAFRTDTVLRTGSVSKAIQTALVAKLVELKRIDWDHEIHQYVSERHFPRKQWKGLYIVARDGLMSVFRSLAGKDVNITVRQLITMTAGIRTSEELRDFRQIRVCHNVTDTLAYFANDPLVAKPGTKFFYSNWGWHLIGAALESVLKQDFEQMMNKLFTELHLSSTRLSRREALISHRSRPYTKSLTPDRNHHQLKSAGLIEDLGRPLPWLPMGGVITSVADLLTFNDAMLSSYKGNGYLKASTVGELWTAGPSNYGMGWYVSQYRMPNDAINGFNGSKSLQYIHYSGSVAGSVTTIALIPELDISVAIIANLGGVSLDAIASIIINNFVLSIDSIVR